MALYNTRGSSSASTQASSWDPSLAGTGGSVGVMGLLPSSGSSDIGDVEMSPSGLGHEDAGSAPVVIVAEAGLTVRMMPSLCPKSGTVLPLPQPPT